MTAGEFTEAEKRLYSKQFEALELAIKPILAGQRPELQGAVLADLLSLWIAGHEPDARDEALNDVIELTRKLITVNEMMLFGPAGHPARKGKFQ